jgi:uncharacterized protein YqhQ
MIQIVVYILVDALTIVLQIILLVYVYQNAHNTQKLMEIFQQKDVCKHVRAFPIFMLTHFLNNAF